MKIQQNKSNNKDRDYYFEEIGDNFDKWMSDYDVYRRALLICKILGDQGQNKSCLEIGCGTGKISEVIRHRVDSLTVSDISETLAQGVGSRLNIKWIQQDACNLSIADNSFDVVISSECIEHVPDPEKALAEMVRVLKSNGVLIVTTPNKLWYPILWIAMKAGIRNFAGREIWLFPWKAAKILKMRGLTNICLDGCHLFPWQIPLAKKLLPLFDKFGKVLYPLMINFCITAVKAPRE
uniref:2-polyprenyl-6-hydroxyphenyl methylase / 3-demethylubiquinone-9 3-methyltransferase n=1 Tax=Candidatus Kentrum sp. SD TaxID=2126332 RepID=A0A451BMN3_9GAMM|nr:MAG: 2-polyprenyl-6-hydroxyphenyl methylase / 3-demethylubiquinone-9 3-methyltransferase [Candidatus Kentron sp. SD]